MNEREKVPEKIEPIDGYVETSETEAPDQRPKNPPTKK